MFIGHMGKFIRFVPTMTKLVKQLWCCQRTAPGCRDLVVLGMPWDVLTSHGTRAIPTFHNLSFHQMFIGHSVNSDR